MPTARLEQRLAAEFLGTAFLLATVIGSCIMGERLAGGNLALALLTNTLPTGAILVVLIAMLSPIWSSLQPCGDVGFLDEARDHFPRRARVSRRADRGSGNRGSLPRISCSTCQSCRPR